MKNENAIDRPKVILQTWYQDIRGRTWVILDVQPLYPINAPKEVTMLQYGKSEPVVKPYDEIVKLVETNVFKQIFK